MYICKQNYVTDRFKSYLVRIKKITICFLDKQVALLNSWNLFPAARALIGYFKVTWHLTTKLFPAKISERATMQSLWRQRVTVHCYPRMLSARKIYFHKFVHKNVFLRGLYNRSLKDWSLRKQLFFFPGISMSLGKQD